MQGFFLNQVFLELTELSFQLDFDFLKGLHYHLDLCLSYFQCVFAEQVLYMKYAINFFMIMCSYVLYKYLWINETALKLISVSRKHTHTQNCYIYLYIFINLTLILIRECQTVMQAIKNTGSVMMIASRRLLVCYMVVIYVYHNLHCRLYLYIQYNQAGFIYK